VNDVVTQYDGKEQDRREIRFLEGIVRRLPTHVPSLKTLGDLYTRAGLIREGLETDLLLANLRPDDDMVWYNLACSHALSGEPERAMKALRRAVNLGYSDAEWMASDADLESLHDLPGFRLLLARIEQRNGTD
jgi:tetratricopeptide (TPR) repeat protein